MPRALPFANVFSRSIVLAAFVAGCGGTGGTGGSEAEVDTGPDTTPPTVVSKYPANDQQNVPSNSELAITFSEPLNRRTVNTTNVVLTQGGAGTGGVTRLVSLDATGKVVTITRPVNSPSLLEENRRYVIQLTSDIKDVAGNPLQEQSWEFWSGPMDTVAPTWGTASAAATVLGFDSVNVSWNGHAVDNVVSTPGDIRYLVYFQDLGGDLPASDSVDTGQMREFGSVFGQLELTVTGLNPKTYYAFGVRAQDRSGYLSDFNLVPDFVRTEQAGHLYAANFVTNSIASINDAGVVTPTHPTLATTTPANQTELFAPTGVWVQPDPDPAAPDESMLYVSNNASNSITAYQNAETTLGQYGLPDQMNAKPLWTIQGDLTQLAGPTALWLDEVDADTRLLYVANIRGKSRILGSNLPIGNILIFNVAGFEGKINQSPFGVIKSQDFRSPIGFAVSKPLESRPGYLYVINRDSDPSANGGAGDSLGSDILVFEFQGSLDTLKQNADNRPARTIFGIESGPCVNTTAASSLCGPSGIALEEDRAIAPNHIRLYIANRGRNNVLIFDNAQTAGGNQTPIVVDGAKPTGSNPPVTGFIIDHPNAALNEAAPNSVFFDSTSKRLFVTTRNGQSVLIFDTIELLKAENQVNGEVDIPPVRTIRGSRTILGQPTKLRNSLGSSIQSSGPFGITVVNNRAYVAVLGLHAIPVFDVSPGRDAAPQNTPPDRLLMDPMQGLSGAALDLSNDRLYLTSFHANLILVYENASRLDNERRSPDRIIGGPATRLDHPVHLVFRSTNPPVPDQPGTLYVVNQSGHSVSIFDESFIAGVSQLSGDKVPTRYLGPADGTNPPFDASSNLAEMVYPTGIAIDEPGDVLYVSNRDVDAFEDFAGRKILAYHPASTVGASPAALEMDANAGNVPPTWKIEGDPPPPPVFGNPLPVTDRTTLKRPAALLFHPALDRLFVANREARTVLVFYDVSQRVLKTVSDSTLPKKENLAPTWIIAHAELTSPAGFAGYFTGTEARDELYVADIGTSSILAFEIGNLPTPDTDITSAQSLLRAPRAIRGITTGLGAPLGLALDPTQ